MSITTRSNLATLATILILSLVLGLISFVALYTGPAAGIIVIAAVAAAGTIVRRLHHDRYGW